MSFEESGECVDPGAFVTVPFGGGGAGPCFSNGTASSLPSAALPQGAHTGYAGSSEAHGHLQALSSCSSSFLSQ